MTKKTSSQFLAFEKKSKQDKDKHSKEKVSLEENFQALTQNLPIGIVLTTVEGTILNVNREGLQILGYNALKDVEHISMEALYYDIRDREILLKKLEKGQVKDLEIRLKKSDDSIIWCSLSSVSRESGPQGRYLISSVQDISHRKKIEEEKSELLLQLTQKDKLASIGQLAAGIAHEINNPVGYVTSNLNSLEAYMSDFQTLIGMGRELIEHMDDTRLPENLAQQKEKILNYSGKIDLKFLQEDINELITDCIDGLHRIKKIVMDLKNFAHPGEKDIESVDVNAGIETTLNVAANELKYKATIYKDLKEVALINGIPQQINQVFLNILLNAAQAIEKTGEIRIKTWQENKTVMVAISDTGCGIDPENISKVFDPFFTTKEVGKGTGLGMNITYNIIQKHGGSITVESQKGKGSTFTISLPVPEDTE